MTTPADGSVLTGTAVNEVAALAQQAQVIQRTTIGANEYANRELYKLDADPESPPALEFRTLDGFAQYLLAEEEQSLVHVVSPTYVEAVSVLYGASKHLRRRIAIAEVFERDRDRESDFGFRFGRRVDLETLTIALQTQFAPTPELESLRKFCASIRSTQEIGVDDDGVSQSVQAKSGVAAVLATPVKNPWLLAPFRTFAEVPQPPSWFVLRFSRGDADGMTAALFETGDTRWRLDAVKSVANYLEVLVAPKRTVLV